MSRPDLRGARVGITAERRAEEQAALVRALGGVAVVCPTVRVAWEDDVEAPQRWVDTVCAGVDDAVFMTGMGTGRLLDHAGAVGRVDEVVRRLAEARVVVRGSKAQPLLRRAGVRVDMAPQPATSGGVLAALGTDLRGRRAVVQLAGPEPSSLTDGMRAAGAEVTGISMYRYPPDAAAGAADAMVEAILAGDVDAVTFTSAPAVEGLMAAARRMGEWAETVEKLSGLVVAAVGPVTADALLRNGMPVHVQPSDEPRTGPMMRALAEHIASRRRA